MKARIGHLQLNVSNLDFYRQLLNFLEFKIIDEWPTGFGASDGSCSIWIFAARSKYSQPFHRKAVGINHVAFRVSSREAVDQFVAQFLERRQIKPLYGGAGHHPEYVKGYYAVYFEDPDRLKLEVAYIPEGES